MSTCATAGSHSDGSPYTRSLGIAPMVTAAGDATARLTAAGPGSVDVLDTRLIGRAGGLVSRPAAGDLGVVDALGRLVRDDPAARLVADVRADQEILAVPALVHLHEPAPLAAANAVEQIAVGSDLAVPGRRPLRDRDLRLVRGRSRRGTDDEHARDHERTDDDDQLTAHGTLSLGGRAIPVAGAE